MPEISLAVTSAVLARTDERPNERQIAYTAATSDIAGDLAQANANNRISLRLGSLIVLTVADTGAIWRSHNGEHLPEFDALFAMLSRFPSQPMRFLCEIAA